MGEPRTRPYHGPVADLEVTLVVMGFAFDAPVSVPEASNKRANPRQPEVDTLSLSTYG